MSDLKNRIKKMGHKEKEEKNANDTLEIINEITDYNNNAQKIFHRASKVDKKRSEPKFEKNIEERVKLRRKKDNLSETPKQKKFNDLLEEIKKEQKTTNYNLFKNYFTLESPAALTEQLYKIKNKMENNELVNVIESGLVDLKNNIKKMSKEEIKIEKPNEIINIVEEILKFNRKKQSGGGSKIPTPEQMPRRSPITLAQVKARNNSEKLKNEIRQLLFSLYRSKKLTKQCTKV